MLKMCAEDCVKLYFEISNCNEIKGIKIGRMDGTTNLAPGTRRTEQCGVLHATTTTTAATTTNNTATSCCNAPIHPLLTLGKKSC